MNGILNVYKEKGFTSHDVVAKLRGICRQRKIGHTGTLDPEAVGVLPVCFGRATKVCDLLTDKDKAYEAVLLLGQVTDTQDVHGQTLMEHEVTVTETQVREVIAGFVGDILQVPPMYSALKVNGQKLYQLARAGKEVERQARPITIHAIEIVDVDLPRVTMRVTCSKGTYIRTLCHDIGAKLGCGGCMAALTRIRVDCFTVEDSLTLAQIAELMVAGTLEERLVAVDSLFEHWPKRVCAERFEKMLYNGNALPAEAFAGSGDRAATIRVYDRTGCFIGVFAWDAKKHQYKPEKMFYPYE